TAPRRACVRALTGQAASATTIGTSAVKSPNQAIDSCTMRHWKWYVPGAVGAVIGKLNVISSPGATSCGTSTRLNPPVELSGGFWAPSRNGFEPSAVQVVPPRSCIVTCTCTICSGRSGDGTQDDTYKALDGNGVVGSSAAGLLKLYFVRKKPRMFPSMLTLCVIGDECVGFDRSSDSRTSSASGGAVFGSYRCSVRRLASSIS